MEEPEAREKRPLGVKVILLMMFVVSILGWLRGVVALVQWSWIEESGAYPGAWYIVLTGFIGGMAFLFCVVILWLRKRWSSRYVRWIFPVALVWYWLDTYLVARSPMAKVDLPFVTGMTLMATVFTWWVLHRQEKREMLKGDAEMGKELASEGE